MRTWREIRGAYGRGRRALRRAMLEPVLVGWPLLHEIVMGALAARGTGDEPAGASRATWAPCDRGIGWRGRGRS